MKFMFKMFILVLFFLLGTVVTVKSDQPQVDMYSKIINDGAEIDSYMSLACRAKGFSTADIILNIKKNHCVLTEDDGVKASEVKLDEDGTFWRRDHVIISTSDMSDYSCEVSHAASRFRVEKVWDPDSGGRGRIISSKFIDTSAPDLSGSTDNSTDQTHIILQCVASGFYPKDITLNIRRNKRILTREDGVKSSRVCSFEGDTFSRMDYVEVLKWDVSDYSCEVNHDASSSYDERVWEQRRPHVSDGENSASSTAITIFSMLLSVAFIGAMWYLRIRCFLGWTTTHRTINTSVVQVVTITPTPVRTVSESCLITDDTSDSGVPASGRSSSYVPVSDRDY